MNILLLTVLFPIVVGFLFLFLGRVPKKYLQWSTIALSILLFLDSIYIFSLGQYMFMIRSMQPISLVFNLVSSPFSAFFFILATFFTILISFYSIKFFNDNYEDWHTYLGLILITIGSTAGALFASDYISLIVFWGVLGLTLYLLISLGGPKASSAAKKTLLIIGGTDALMLLGVALLLLITRNLNISIIKIQLNSWMPICAFLCILSAALAKAGAMPFHTWIPDSAESAPLPVVAYLPAALDKLLGIYLLMRIVGSIHNFANSIASPILLIIGSITIVAGVMMALVQHDLKKLLAYHAVSQVGYMILGIGTGSIIGIAGGLLHMVNNTIYKTALFLGGGAIEKRTGSTDLDHLGGLLKYMPLTFIAMALSALAISGIPPFNGFVSKWLIYQSIISLRGNGPWWIIWLIAAMFGSALTLASFMKLLHASFLGGMSEKLRKNSGNLKEVSLYMTIPMLLLSALSLILGIFIFLPPINILLSPIMGAINLPTLSFSGIWMPTLATISIIFGLLIGVIIYWLTITNKNLVEKRVFYGGEELNPESIRVSGTDFYNTIQKRGWLRKIYRRADKKDFDVYELGSRLTFSFTNLLKHIHNGLLHTYLAWCLVGLVIIIFVLISSIR